ncbi:hypothetical protein D3C71_1589270 [compost metagenome]
MSEDRNFSLAVLHIKHRWYETHLSCNRIEFNGGRSRWILNNTIHIYDTCHKRISETLKLFFFIIRFKNDFVRDDVAYSFHSFFYYGLFKLLLML